MLSREQNDLVTRTGPGTPMGEVMRRYWMPALLSAELLEPDCPPVRVKLLGEDLVAFRNTQGHIGVLEEFCAHRRASLWLGRNEENGLRCVFHGWKYDVGGNCVDQMNEPLQFKEKVHLTSYPTVELGGVVWTYMGPPDKKPPLPAFEWTQAPESHRHVSKVVQECNWLQGLEGGVDTSHAPILHRAMTFDTTKPTLMLESPFVRGGAPTLEVELTDYGYRYFGIRSLGEKETYVRGYHYVMPFHQLRPTNASSTSGLEQTQHVLPGHMWAPMDDESCMVYNWYYSTVDAPLTSEDRLERSVGNGPQDVDRKNGFRSIRNKGNNWLIDRQVQKTETFTGIEGVNVQDRAVQESMGTVVDRTKEGLGPADKAIIQARRLLLEAARIVQDGGDPPGIDGAYYSLRAYERVFPRESDWHAEMLAEMYPKEKSARVVS